MLLRDNVGCIVLNVLDGHNAHFFARRFYGLRRQKVNVFVLYILQKNLRNPRHQRDNLRKTYLKTRPVLSTLTLNGDI